MKQKSKWLLQELMKYIKGDVLCKMKMGALPRLRKQNTDKNKRKYGTS